MNKWSMWKKFTEDNLEENPKEPGIYKIRICGESIYRFLGEDKNGEFWGRWLKKWKNWRSTLVLVDRSSPVPTDGWWRKEEKRRGVKMMNKKRGMRSDD